MWDLVNETLAARSKEIMVFNDAAILMGEEWSRAHTHEERVAKINEVYRSWWQEKGGEGSHPMEYQP